MYPFLGKNIAFLRASRVKITKKPVAAVLLSLPGVEVGDLGHPAGANAVGSVDEHHGDDGDIPLGLYTLVVIPEVFQNGIIMLVEDVPVHSKLSLFLSPAISGDGAGKVPCKDHI